MTKLLLLSVLSALATLSFTTALSSNSVLDLQRRASNDSIATAWYPSWVATKFPPSKISWSQYNSMTFAFALTSPDPSSIVFSDDSDKTVLTDFVTEAKKNNVKALLSIGGWTGSVYFSTAVATAASRTQFVKAVTDLATQYKLDGIDFDWEYPGKQGIGCNKIDEANDTANFLSFLKQLKQDPVGSKLMLTAAVGITPFAVNGSPSSDVSGFADLLDHISIMNYDIWGAWESTVGPNAPLDDTCAGASNQRGSAVTAVKAWISAGIPAQKLALGVAAYGRSYTVDKSAALSNGQLAAYPAFDKSNMPLGEGETAADATTKDVCGNPNGISGIFYFEGLIAAGYLSSNGSAAAGMDYRFDECSKTPYVYNPNTGVMISYDDASSFAAKGQFIKENGLGGFAVWYGPGDSSNDILLNAINGAISGSSPAPAPAPAPASSASATATASGAVATPTTTKAAGHCALRRRRSRRTLN
jgi:chitinase